MNWDAALAEYDRDLRARGAAERTRRAYAVDLGGFVEWSGPQGLAPGDIRHRDVRRSFEADDVSAMGHRLFEGRVQFHDGDDEVAPGITVHHVGGHTGGLQFARVKTARGWVVLASDASHFYANFEEMRAYSTVFNVGDMLEGFTKLKRLASSPQHVVPGHDPLVLQRYPAPKAGVEGIAVRLDVEPKG